MLKNKHEYSLYIFILILVITINFLIILILTRESRRNKLSVEFDSERILSEAISYYFDNRLLDYTNDNKQIIGFGIYESSGFSIMKYGNAPQNLANFLICPPFLFNKERKTIILLRPIAGIDRNTPHMMRHGMNYNKKNMKISYIELKINNYYNRNNFFYTGMIFLPLFFISFLIILGILYKKNLEYKSKIEKQGQLVKLGEISRTLSHEIKNPLGAIKIQTGYLKKILPKNEKDFKIIDEEIDRICLLTNRIGDFIRDPIGNPINIEIIEFIKNIITKFDYKITFNYEEKAIFIKFDPERLRSVLENIFINAMESITENKKKENADIKINMKKEKMWLLISIFDNGKGLIKEYNDKIFDPFFTTKTKGSGLGLSIAKRFIEAMNGKIEILNRQEGGAEVIISLKLEMNDENTGS